MRRQPLFWQIYSPFLVVVALALTAGTIISCLSFRAFYYNQVEANLYSNARVLEPDLVRALETGDQSRLKISCGDFADKAHVRITVVDRMGVVLCDSAINPDAMDNHGMRIEIKEAFASGIAKSTRPSATLGKEFFYVSQRLDLYGQPLAVLRMSVATDNISATMLAIYGTIIGGFFLLFLVVALVSWAVSKKLVVPIHLFKEHVERMSAGNFTAFATARDSDPSEIVALGSSINEIQAQLDLRMKKIIRQKAEKDGIFSSIMEGVIAIDEFGSIISINYAAYNMLDLPDRRLKDEKLVHLVTNHDLHEFIACSLNDANAHEMELRLEVKGEIRYLTVKAAPLKVSASEINGAVLVINDVSRLRRLENLRKEFVANVSHELKTPLTTIHGFAETLLNPSVISVSDREEYLKIILKNSIRISAIIDDLLMLSKLEQASDASEIFLSPTAIAPIIHNAIDSCQSKASAHAINMEFEQTANPLALINPNLLEQALVNLLDNAIKYSDDGSSVVISLRVQDSSVVIEVKDFGIGIPKHLLPRLFERFYRVDKARSRKMGGTGLGLSIVKHILIVHHGRIEVESDVSKGSLFRVILPIYS